MSSVRPSVRLSVCDVGGDGGAENAGHENAEHEKAKQKTSSDAANV